MKRILSVLAAIVLVVLAFKLLSFLFGLAMLALMIGLVVYLVRQARRS